MALAISCNNPPSGVVGVAYSHDLTATGGVPDYIFSIPAGLPSGLTVDTEGHISGTPTTPGIYPFTAIVVDDAAATDSVDCSITIASRPKNLTK